MWLSRLAHSRSIVSAFRLGSITRYRVRLGVTLSYHRISRLLHALLGAAYSNAGSQRREVFCFTSQRSLEPAVASLLYIPQFAPHRPANVRLELPPYLRMTFRISTNFGTRPCRNGTNARMVSSIPTFKQLATHVRVVYNFFAETTETNVKIILVFSFQSTSINFTMIIIKR